MVVGLHCVSHTWFHPELTEAWHTDHVANSVGDETFLIFEHPAVIPGGVVEAWHEDCEGPFPEVVQVCDAF